MIVVDSSVWIDNIRDLKLDHVQRLKRLAQKEILVGDIILLEVLGGARDEAHAAKLQRQFDRLRIVPMLDPGLASIAARNYRTLRAKGITVRKLIDIVIGTFCIEHGHELLQNDRDFLPMARHLGLRLV